MRYYYLKNQLLSFLIILPTLFLLSCDSNYKSKCVRGKETANKDFRQGVYKQPYSKGLFLRDTEFQSYLIKFAKENYGIEVYESTSEYDERKECYEQEMSELLNKIFHFKNITNIAWDNYLCEFPQKNNLPNFYCDKVNIDSLASFASGVDGLFEYLNKNLVYPKHSLDKNIEGRVFVSFIVEANGNISNIEIIRGVSNEIDSVVVDVISKMPTWKPAIYKGKKVNSKYIIPIKFAIDREDK